jgi:5-methylcytosine-specific restriction endonuclease McrA
MTSPPPSADQQLTFLSKLQQVFAEGDFSATYKFALLISLGELAVEEGRDDGDVLRLTVNQIAEKFIELYWQQATPFPARSSSTEPDVLFQNKGVQAVVVSALVEFREINLHSSAPAARSAPGYQALVRKIAKTVNKQPLKFLQNFGGSTQEFLYERREGDVVLRPGVGFCLRRFQPLMQQLARNRWVDHIRQNKKNAPLLGEVADLDQFLFETPRRALAKVGECLTTQFGRDCFYCRKPYAQPHVDHFIPFALYRMDQIHNFVATHPRCNSSKSDTLAAHVHLVRWIARVREREDHLMEIGNELGIAGNVQTTLRVAKWAYQMGLDSGASSWIASDKYERIDERCIEAFGSP